MENIATNISENNIEKKIKIQKTVILFISTENIKNYIYINIARKWKVQIEGISKCTKLQGKA